MTGFWIGLAIGYVFGFASMCVMCVVTLIKGMDE